MRIQTKQSRLAILNFSITLLTLSTLLFNSSVHASSRYVEVLPGVYVNSILPLDTVILRSDLYGCDNEKDYEKVPGISHFCLKKNSALDIVNGQHMIEGRYINQCPERYSREPQSTICIKNHLALAIVENQVQLVEQKLNCADDYEQKPGELVCSSKNDTATPQALLDTAPECLPNFVIPKNQALCREMDIVYGATDVIDDTQFISTEKCETSDAPGWRENYYSGYCLPTHCGEPEDFDEDVCDTDVQQTYKIVESKIDSACCANSDSYFVRNVPLNSISGLSAVPVIMCAPAFGKHVTCPDPKMDPELTSGNN